MNNNVIKLNESQLRKIVAESVKKVLKEYNAQDILNSHYSDIESRRMPKEKYEPVNPQSWKKNSSNSQIPKHYQYNKMNESDEQNGIEKTWWGLHIVYDGNISISGGENNIKSDNEAVRLAQQKAKEEENIKYVEAYRVDLPAGESFGKTTILARIEGLGKETRAFDDPQFRSWYDKTAHEQD